MSALRYVDLRHDCEMPNTDHLPEYVATGQTLARWRCPECKSRWDYMAYWGGYGRLRWEQQSRPSRRWRRAEAKRLAAQESSDDR